VGVTTDMVDTLTLVDSDVRHHDVTDDQLGTARDDVTNPDPSTFLSDVTQRLPDTAIAVDGLSLTRCQKVLFRGLIGHYDYFIL